MEQEMYNDIMISFDAINQKIKDLKAKKEALRVKLLTALKLDGLTNVQSETHSLAFTVSKRRTFEKDKAIDFLEKHNEDLDAYYLESEYETLKIKANNNVKEI